MRYLDLVKAIAGINITGHSDLAKPRKRRAQEEEAAEELECSKLFCFVDAI